MRKRVSVLLFLILFISFAFASSPFGITIGMTLDEMENAGMDPYPVYDAEGYYWVYAPDPADVFTDYIVKVSDEYGVYIIQAYTADIVTDDEGTELKDLYLDLEEEMDYAFDYGERYWDVDIDSDDFMSELVWGDLYFYSEWYPEYGNYIADDIIDAALIVIVTDYNLGMIELEYLADTYWDAEFDGLEVW